MGEHDNVFAEEVRTELLSMFTGMALQGLSSDDDMGRTPLNIGRRAVEMADGAITALEEYHLRRKDELIAKRQAEANAHQGNLELVQ